MDWLFYALLSPLLFALVNIADDNLVRRVYKSPEFGTIVSGLFALLPLGALLFIPFKVPDLQVVFFALLAGFLTTVYYLFYFKALLVEAPSVVISLFQISRALIPFLAYFLLKEMLRIDQYIGAAVIFAGAVGITAVDIKRFKFSKALLLIFTASMMTATIAILDKTVYSRTDFFNGYVFFCLGMGLGAGALMAVTKEGRKFPRNFVGKFKSFIFLFILTEFLNIGAEFTLAYAISGGPVTLVKVIEGMQPLFVLFIALILYPFTPKYFREAAQGQIPKKIFFIFIMLLGLYFIYRG